MSPQRFVLGIIALLLAAAPAVAGGDGSSAWSRYWTSWHRNNAWPEPFVHPDRACVWEFFDLETACGWQQQNLLGEPHFESDNSRLSPAGLAKVRMIFTQSPPQYRTVFVEQGWTDDVTQRRMEAAQKAADSLARGVPPAVLASQMRLQGTPADYVNTINTKFTQGLHDPVPPLPTWGEAVGTASGD